MDILFPITIFLNLFQLSCKHFLQLIISYQSNGLDTQFIKIFSFLLFLNMFNGCPLDCKILSYNVCELVLNLDINVQQESLHRQFFMNLKQSDWKDFRLYSKIKFNSFFLSNDLLDFFQRTSFSSLFSFLYIFNS